MATVDKNGKVTGVLAGSATITVTSKDGSKKSTCKVTVSDIDIKITAISYKNTNPDLEVKQTLQLQATITPSDATNQEITWRSNDTKVATVNQSGKVTGISEGSVKITAKAADGSSKVASININIIKSTKLAEFQKAFQETAWAYYMRGTRIQYNSAKGNTVWFSPEEATGKNMNYLVCAAYAKNVYNELFKVKIPAYTENHLNYAKRYQGKRKEVIAFGEQSESNYVIKYYTGKLENGKVPIDTTETLVSGKTTKTTKTNLLNHLEIGDVITYTGHTVVLYDFIYDSDGNKTDAYILESAHNGSKNISTKIPNGEAAIDGYTIGNANPHLLYFNQSQTDNDLLKGRTEKKINEGSLRFSKLSISIFWKNMMDKSNIDINKSFSIIRVITENDKKLVYNFIENNDDVVESNVSDRIYHNNEVIEISNSSKQRMKFSNIYIEKIANITSIGSVKQGDSITYTITIRNNSNKDYKSDIEVIENIDKNVKYNKLNKGEKCEYTNNTLKCNIGKLKSGDEVKIQYTVTVTGDYGNKIVSTGTVAGIPSSTIVSKIQKELSTNQKTNIKTKYNENKSKYKGIDLINKIYSDACGINLGLTNSEITKLIINEKESSGGSSTQLNTNNKFSKIVLNDYWNTLKVKTYNSTVNDYDMKTWNYNKKNDTQYNWEKFSRADTIYEEDFQTGDILIYINTNDKEIIKNEYITYDNGTYAYIYIEEKGFVGVNSGDGKVNGHSSARNEFNAKYYDNNSLKLYKDSDTNEKVSSIEDSTFFNSTFLNNQTLLGKDYYVILRPAINYTCK